MLQARVRGGVQFNGRHCCVRVATSALPSHSYSTPTLHARRISHATSAGRQCSIPGAKAVHSSSNGRLVNTVAAQVSDAETYEVAAGPAFMHTLKMLEWRRLCEHLSKHASTALGKRMCSNLEVPIDMSTSVRLLNETRAMLAMENDYMSLLDYGGINTSDAEGAIKRAAKGGMVSGKQLRGLVAMLQGAV
eukprot:GHUV01031369.1.p1 GENE.GHUV01031369.1~~GHUV01031369.1.p1  ORF type:complete len:191 (+),score=15.69 GHUV01031369.1:257-829(+)